MSQIVDAFENDTLKIYISGRIDSVSAPNIESEIRESLKKAHNNLIIDMNNVEYISSAGLRIMLKLKKEEKNLSIINVTSDIYEVFEMTGFTEMISIQKAFRNLNIDGCQVIGKGANGTVYRYDDETIIKVYNNINALTEIKKERELARKAFILGIPTAISFDIVNVNGKFGSVFELLKAESLASLIVNNPIDVDKYVKIYVDLLKEIHSISTNEADIPSMREKTLSWIEDLKAVLSLECYKKLIRLFEEIDDNSTLLHGDYHMQNVLIQNGEVVLIDMDTLCRGSIYFEFGFIFNAYCGFLEFLDKNDPTFLGISKELSNEIWHKTLDLYFNNKTREEIEKIEEKAKLIGYIRLLRRTIRRKDSIVNSSEIIETYLKNITNLTNNIDTLN